jgi:hypothetical protein
MVSAGCGDRAGASKGVAFIRRSGAWPTVECIRKSPSRTSADNVMVVACQELKMTQSGAGKPSKSVSHPDYDTFARNLRFVYIPTLIYNFRRGRKRAYIHERVVSAELYLLIIHACKSCCSRADFNAKKWAPARHNFWRIQPKF